MDFGDLPMPLRHSLHRERYSWTAAASASASWTMSFLDRLRPPRTTPNSRCIASEYPLRPTAMSCVNRDVASLRILIFIMLARVFTRQSTTSAVGAIHSWLHTLLSTAKASTSSTHGNQSAPRTDSASSSTLSFLAGELQQRNMRLTVIGRFCVIQDVKS